MLICSIGVREESTATDRRHFNGIQDCGDSSRILFIAVHMPFDSMMELKTDWFAVLDDVAAHRNFRLFW